MNNVGCRTNAGELFRAGRGAGSFGEQPKPRVSKCKRKIVKTLSPTLGIAGEKPQHSEDLQRKARPEGERPNNHPNKLLLARIAFMEKYEVDYSESSYFVF